jgi:hypothetical protein
MVAQHLAADRPDLVAGLLLSATCARADEGLRAVLARWDGGSQRVSRTVPAGCDPDLGDGPARHDHLALDAAAQVPAAPPAWSPATWS